MREDVAELVEERSVVEQRLRRVSPFPEGTPPTNEDTDLLGDVAQKVLHVLGQVSARSPDDEVEMVRGEIESEELDVMKPDSPSEYAAQDLVRLLGRTEEEPALEAPDGDEENRCGIQHARRSGHLSLPSRHEAEQESRQTRFRCPQFTGEGFVNGREGARHLRSPTPADSGRSP
jgi:hypothetical protein